MEQGNRKRRYFDRVGLGFREFGLWKVTAGAYAANVPSQKALLKADMTLEGALEVRSSAQMTRGPMFLGLDFFARSRGLKKLLAGRILCSHHLPERSPDLSVRN